MRVRDWMTIDPLTVTPSTDVATARHLLSEHGIRHLPVVEANRIVGVLSDRDVRVSQAALQQVTEQMAAAAPRVETAGIGLVVSTVMSSPAHVIAADEPVQAAARLMLSRRVSALPVVDDAGTLAGIITTTDCLLAFLEQSGGSPGAD